MKMKGLEPRMTSKWLICNGFHKGQAVALSFMTCRFVR